MPTRFEAASWLVALAGFVAVARGSPVLVDQARSRIEISVSATVGSFVAELPSFTLSATEGAGTGKISAGVFRCAFAAIKTGNTERDRDMNEWQQTDKFPEVVFTLTAVEATPGGGSAARGRLLFHGVERPVVFPIAIGRHGTDLDIESDVTIDTRDYGLPIIKKFLVLKVNPLVRVHLHLVGKLAGS